jgi:hypothetical protein
MPEGLPVPIAGLFEVCRMCVRMAEQFGQGSENCALMCGGPSKGMAYPLYSGPLTAGWIADHCVVCGELAERKLDVEGRGTVGTCLKHLGVLVPAKAADLPTDSVVVVPGRLRSLYDVAGVHPVEDLGFEPEDVAEDLELMEGGDSAGNEG